MSANNIFGCLSCSSFEYAAQDCEDAAQEVDPYRCPDQSVLYPETGSHMLTSRPSVDEISMLDPLLFVKLNLIAKVVRGSSRAFGERPAIRLSSSCTR